MVFCFTMTSFVDDPFLDFWCTVRVQKIALSITGQVWIFVKKTIQIVRCDFRTRTVFHFQIDWRFASHFLFSQI
jgi:hypothetical protein